MKKLIVGVLNLLLAVTMTGCSNAGDKFEKELPQNIMEKLCEYIGFETKGNKKIDTIFYNKAPLDVSFMFTFISRLKEKEELFFEKRIPQK